MHITTNPTSPQSFTLKSEQVLSAELLDVFEFFSEASNLEEITPPWLKFRIDTPAQIEMREGTLIDYRLKLHHIPLRWRSEITSWEPPHRFVDSQSRGPYRFWIHEHTFIPQASGTLVRDEIRYAVPGGRLVHSLFVKPDLLKIFQYRQEKLASIFPD